MIRERRFLRWRGWDLIGSWDPGTIILVPTIAIVDRPPWALGIAWLWGCFYLGRA